MMPSPRAKEAPPKFTGKYEDVKHFIKRYKSLCAIYNVDEDAERCERILDYCSHKVIRLIEALKSYTEKDWAGLESDLLRYYDADRKETRYIIRDLTQLTQDWKHRTIKTLTRRKSYERRFITIGGWLFAKKKISDSEQAAYFWKGINKELRKRIEDRLAARIPPLPLTEAFPMADVIRVVEKLFERNRFDYNLADSESDLPDGNDDSDTSEDESESEDNDKAYAKTPKHTKKRKCTSRYSSFGEEDLVAPARQAHKTHKPITKEVSGKKQPVDKHTGQEDVEQIIRQLGKLSLDDPKYGLLYYRAIKLDTTVAQCVAPPVTARVAVKNNNAFRPTFPNSVPLAPPAVPAQTKAPTMAPFDSRPPMTCYGCGISGHGIRNCPALQEMLRSGTLMRDQGGRITVRDGSVVRREQGETIIEAAGKRQGKQSHFFTMGASEITEYYQSDEEDEYERRVEVLAAEHQPRLIHKTRKEIFDGVLMPSRKGKENVRPLGATNERQTPANTAQAAAKPGIGTRANPSRWENPPSGGGKPSKGPEEFISTPIDARQPRRVIVADNDVDMDDPQPSKQAHTQEKPSLPRPRAPLRQSQVSSQVEGTQVVNTILNTPVTMRIGEVLASSQELLD